MFKELFNEADLFKALKKYTLKKETTDKSIIISVNFEDADAVDALIKADKKLDKKLNVKDSTGSTKKYYFDV